MDYGAMEVKKGRRERRLRGKLSLTLLKPSNYIEELKP